MHHRQTGSSVPLLMGVFSLSPTMVSPSTLTGPKSVGWPWEPPGALGQPHQSISTGTLREWAPACNQCFTTKRRGEEEEGERETPKELAPHQHPAIPSKPSSSCLQCLLWGYHGWTGVSLFMEPFLRCKQKAAVAASLGLLCLYLLPLLPLSSLLLDHDLSFCFLAGTWRKYKWCGQCTPSQSSWKALEIFWAGSRCFLLFE